MKSCKLNFIALPLILILYFSVCYYYHKHQIAHIESALTEHALVAAEPVWNYDTKQLRNYLGVVGNKNSYAHIKISDQQGKIFEDRTFTLEDGLDIWLDEQGFFPKSLFSREIMHGASTIGTIQVVWRDTSIYFYSYALLVSLLLATNSLLYSKTYKARRSLQTTVEVIQKQMLELKRQKEYIEEIYNLIPEGLVTIDSEKLFISNNRSYNQIITYWADILNQSDAEIRGLFQKELVRKIYQIPDGQCVLTLDQQHIHIEYASTIISNFDNIDRVVSIRDVTKLKIMERQLMQSQKLEAVGRLAAGIAHEINTPSQYVLSNNSFISDSWPDVESVMTSLEALQKNTQIPQENEWLALSECFEQADWDYLKIELPKAMSESAEGLRRIACIVDAMRQFSHPSGDSKSMGDINKALKATVEIARNEWKYHANVHFDLAENLPLVPCFLDELNQVFLAMIVNSTHAIQEKQGEKSELKGAITITSTTTDTGEQAIVMIGDDGAGMRKDVKERVFDPFFTTKQVNKGTGQGLAIAYDVIVNRHQGQIRAESELGEGTTFSIYLPLDQSVETG